MDLNAMLNNESAGSSHARTNQPPAQQLPSTPVHPSPGQSFRDYGQTTQASPSRPMSQDLGPPRTSSLFGSPPPSFRSPGQYANRQPPPTLQHMPSNEMRSPSVAGPGPAPSPYRQTPSASGPGGSGGYPFPGPGHSPTSPVQMHQYPPQGAYHRDSYPHPPSSLSIPGPPSGSSLHGPPILQASPVGTPGAPHPYIHQRSQSTHSTPTPISAQPQGPYGAPYVQGSPVTATRPHPSDPYARQASQPPTPLGPPLSNPRQSSYPQPPSPYQQRQPPPVSHNHIPYMQAAVTHKTPPAPLPPSLPRQSNTHSAYDSYPSIDPRRSRSQSDRDKSLSVSPKTRVPSLPSSTGQPATIRSDTESIAGLSFPSSAVPREQEQRRQDRAMTPAKRKLDERDLRPDELEKRDLRPAPFEKVNGNHTSSSTEQSSAHASASPVVQKKVKRVKYRTPPIWAQSARDHKKLKAANFILHKPVMDHVAELNGKSEVKQERSRHGSPEEKRSAPPPAAVPQAAVPQASTAAPEMPNMGKPLGPWEISITGTPPMHEMTKTVADFLYLNIVGNDRRGELISNGVEFEVEAKLGTILDRNTNSRLALPVITECVLNHRETAFRSSMTEAQHMRYNEYLNEAVRLAFPKNKANATNPRVPLDYKHRHEIDRFFELPSHMRQNLPPYVESLIPSRHSVKVRVTYDEKTGEVLAKIVKARVADLDIYLPKNLLDIRISINLEMTWDMPVEELEKLVAAKRKDSPDRNKDRLSYQHGPYQVDLTQVKSAFPAGLPPGKESDKEHELEIELNVPALLEQAKRLRDGEDNQYMDLVEGFVNNAILLSRKASDFRG